MNSILTSVKSHLGIQEEYTHFDNDIIMDINSAFLILNQLGIGPETPFTIEDKTAEWSDFIADGKIDMVRPYVVLRVKLLFDPPASSHLVESINKQISEFEFRMSVEAEKDYLPEVSMDGIYEE